MEPVTLNRDEWFAVARELAASYGGSAPAGLRARVAALLNETPAGWGGEACTLDLAPDSAEAVRRVVQRGRGTEEHPGLARSQVRAIGDVTRILREDRAASPARYRFEHRSEDTIAVVGWSSAADARQAELSQHAARLEASGASGELVLVDLETGEELARRRLRSTST